MPRILIVDDEEKIRLMIKKYADFENYETAEASDGMEAIVACKNNEFDCIIMDIMMPELDGFSAVKEIRKFTDTPVIMLSARGEEYDKIHGFELGVDDYVVKPFSPRELLMRVAAIIKRCSAQKETEVTNEQYVFDGLVVDFTARMVTVDGETINLSPKEYELLFYLVKNKRIAVTRDTLLSEIWGYDYYGDDRTLDTHIKMLRKNLGPYADKIVTLRGVGYRFDG